MTARRAGSYLVPIALVLASLTLGAMLSEFGLVLLDWHAPAETLPPVWFQHLFASADAAPTGRDAREAAIAKVVLPTIDSDVSILPDRLTVYRPSGKPDPPSRDAWTPPLLYVADLATGWTMHPHAEGWWIQEGLSYITANSEGFRDQDHTVDKPAGTLRVAVFGDSFTEGLGIPFENLFSSVMQQTMGHCTGLDARTIEVFNFGVSGFGTAQELETYRKFGRKYKPDVVLLAFFSGNDLSDNTPSLAAISGNDLALMRPFYNLDGDKLVLDARFRTIVRSRDFGDGTSWLGRLRVVQLLSVPVRWFEKRDSGKLDVGALISPPRGAFNRAWTVTERIIAQFASDARADGAQFALATVSATQQVWPDRAARETEARARGIADLAYPDKRLFALSRQEHFTMIPLATTMGEIALSTHTFFHGYPPLMEGLGHWNHNGHNVAGQIIGKALCRRLTDGRSQPASL